LPENCIINCWNCNLLIAVMIMKHFYYSMILYW